MGPLAVADSAIDGLRCEASGGDERRLLPVLHVRAMSSGPCADNELRQFALCVTPSASPQAVTHACGAALLTQFACACRARNR
jgi:hypothetical protein